MGLSNRKYDEIMKEYKERQTAHRQLLEERRETIYAKIPAYRVCEDKIVDLSVVQAKKLVFGSDSDIDGLRQEIAQLTHQKKQLLMDSGFPADYLTPVYECPDCKDTGYIENTKCHCLRQRFVDILYEQSNIKSVLSTENFDAFSYDYYDDTEKERMHKVITDSKLFIENFGDDYQNLLFYGNVGCGKTFVSNCIAKALIEKGFSVVYFTAFQLFEMLAKHTFEGKNQSADIKELHEDIFNCDLLIIDDLGTENSNSFTVSQLFLILNERHCRKKSTIISSNLPLDRISDIYSERSFSRIMGNYKMYKFMGNDIRVMKMKQDNRTKCRL